MENLSGSINSTGQEMVFRGSKLKRKPMFDERGVLQNGVRLSFEKGFGFWQGEEVCAAQCVDDNKMIYVLGKQILIYDMLTEQQRVIDSFGEEEEMTCFKYYKNVMLDDNILYALEASNKLYPSLTSRNISKNSHHKYVLSHLEKEEKIIMVELAYSHQYICLVSQLQQSYRLSLIDSHSQQVYSSDSIYFHPIGLIIPHAHDKLIALYSQRELYLAEIGPELKPVPTRLAQHLSSEEELTCVISSAQSTPQLYAITNQAHLLSITLDLPTLKIKTVDSLELGTYRTVDEKGQVVIRPRIPSSLCCNEYNILVGYYHVEEFTLLKVGPLNTASHPQSIRFSCPMLHKICKMTFAQQTMAVCVVVQVKEGDKHNLQIPIQSDYLKEKGQLTVIEQQPHHHALPKGKIFPVVFNLLLHDTLVQTLRSPVQSILTSTLLTGCITDICLIPTKRLFLVLSTEKRIKAIKYEHIASTSFERMLEWECSFHHLDHPTSLDAHPLTASVAVGFKEGLKLFIICSQGLKSTNIQFPLKNCQAVRYSKYGHKLIAGSLNQLIMINPYDNQVVNTVQFPSGYMLRQLSFLDKDRFIQGIFSNGSTMVMTSEGQKLFEVWNKNTKCLCSAFDSVFDITAVSYHDSITKFYRERGTQQFAVMWTYPYNITKFLITNEIGTIFMGTSLGKIRAHQWPFTDSMKFTKHFTEIQLHSAPITDIQITHDFSLLVSGAEDGSVFISRVNAVSEGIQVNDAQVLSSFKSSYKNFRTLYYLQNYMSTSSTLDGQQEERIIQLESDKSDFEGEYCDIITSIQEDIEEQLKQEEGKRSEALREELAPLEAEIDKLNSSKLDQKEEIAYIIKHKSDTMFKLEDEKLVRARELYNENDSLRAKKQYYETLYAKEISELQELHRKELGQLQAQCHEKSGRLQSECGQLKGECQRQSKQFAAVLREGDDEGEIYKQRTLGEMDDELRGARESGQLLRKRHNKLQHDNSNYEDKTKYFQQLKSEIGIDLENARLKAVKYQERKKELVGLLGEKDEQINREEKVLRKLITANINNYTHEEYLKYKKEELMEKEKYLEGEITQLDKRHLHFQQDFTDTRKQSKELDRKILDALEIINQLKELQKQKKQTHYMRQYKQEEVNKIISEHYRHMPDPQTMKQTLLKVIQLIDGKEQDKGEESPAELAVGQRDHLIKQVVNANNLRKIDDNIRRTIMVKLNRETVTLTCEVNELRKQKKTLGVKLKALMTSIREIKQVEAYKENSSNSMQDMQDIVPTNISMIRRQASKHSVSQKILPFQLYHHSKSQNRTHLKGHSKEIEESSTQLPSLLPSMLKNSLSGGDSMLFGVQETEDDRCS